MTLAITGALAINSLFHVARVFDLRCAIRLPDLGPAATVLPTASCSASITAQVPAPCIRKIPPAGDVQYRRTRSGLSRRSFEARRSDALAHRFDRANPVQR